ncbi:MAG: hypothetical protein WBC94_15015 [Xanthobacteraceae bacterium]
MSILGIVCLSGIIVAFALFAAVLAWGDYQTRDITHPVKERQRPTTQTGVGALKDAAAQAREPIHAA